MIGGAEGLPIEAALPELREVLRAGTAAVLQAPPGAGKTTRVPLALLSEPWLASGGDGALRIILLEPRRLAARAAAAYMARLLREEVGATVGYRMRMDTRVSARTRIEVVTEGVLTRMLQSDPALEGIGIVVFDEFHERSLHADLGLALALESQAVLRPELRLLVMSATLDGGGVAALLGGAAGPAPIVATAGRSWPVETHHLARPLDGPVEPAVARTILSTLHAASSGQRARQVPPSPDHGARREGDDAPAAGAAPPGDILAFLPGAAEIHRVEARLAEAELPAGIRVYPLYGNLPRDVQDRAIEPAPPGERKVVLATSIAETSLTIEGVRIVVDSGFMRVPRFDPRTGMTRLVTVAVTRASADQRRGRAGRLGPGLCYRLWTPGQEAAQLPHGTPEILEADLAPLALELAAWGTADPSSLRWLDPPPPAAFAQARELLRLLGALDDSGAITAHGRRMVAVPLHPRLAHMVRHAAGQGHGAMGTELAAILSERDVLRGAAGRGPGRGGPGAPTEPTGGRGPFGPGGAGGSAGRASTAVDADIRLRLDALRAARVGRIPVTIAGLTVDRGAVQRAVAEAAQWRRLLRIPDPPRERGARADREDVFAAGTLLALAYPDRIGRRRPGAPGRFILRNGRGAVMDEWQPLAREEWIVAAELDGAGRDSRIFLAAPLDPEELDRHFGDQMVDDTAVGWDEQVEAVRAKRTRRLGAIVVHEALVEAEPAAVAATVLEHIRGRGIAALPWGREHVRARQRLAFLHRLDPAIWPDVSDDPLARRLDEWLGPRLHGVRSAADLQRVDLGEALLGLLSWDLRKRLDELAPTHVEVPSGSRVPIDYADPESPVLAVRLQEVFGLADTPRIGGGRVPLTVHLLSPAGRPVQVTRDLASFWRDAYFEVRKDLRGRYPRHYWPDDPLVAEPTRRAKPR